jgi:hypothetical protein
MSNDWLKEMIDKALCPTQYKRALRSLDSENCIAACVSLRAVGALRAAPAAGGA